MKHLVWRCWYEGPPNKNLLRAPERLGPALLRPHTRSKQHFQPDASGDICDITPLVYSPGQPTAHHEEGRHPDPQPESLQQEQEEQEGRHVGAVLGRGPAASPGRQRRALFPRPRDSADLQPHAAPPPHPDPAAPFRRPALCAPPQLWHGAHSGVTLQQLQRVLPPSSNVGFVHKWWFVYYFFHCIFFYCICRWHILTCEAR